MPPVEPFELCSQRLDALPVVDGFLARLGLTPGLIAIFRPVMRA